MRKVNFFEADFEIYKDLSGLPQNITASFPNGDDGSEPAVDLNLILELKYLAEKSEKVKLPRSKLSLTSRYGVPITLQEKSHWYTELMTRAIQQVRALMDDPNPRTTNSEAIFLVLRHILDPSIGSEDEGSGLMSANALFFEVRKLLRKVFYIEGLNKDGSRVFDGFNEILIPEYTYHPIPLLKSMLLGVIEPKLLSDKEFIDVCLGFDLVEHDRLFGDPEPSITADLKSQVINNPDIEIIDIMAKALLKNQERLMKENDKPADSKPTLRFKNTEFDGYVIDNTINISLEMISIMTKDAKMDFIRRFNSLRSIAPKAGMYQASL
jgi:hypothetical protein